MCMKDCECLIHSIPMGFSLILIIKHKTRLCKDTVKKLLYSYSSLLWSGFMITTACAGTPLWTFRPLTSNTIAVPANGTAMVQYTLPINPASHILNHATPFQTYQITTGLNICGNPFVLRRQEFLHSVLYR